MERVKKREMRRGRYRTEAKKEAKKGINNDNNNNNNDDNLQLRPNAKIPFIPGGVSYKLKRALNKAGCNVHMTAGRKLQSILCAKNKTKMDPLEKSGIYQYHCPSHKIDYVGET